jgi:hypothetical protein
VNHFATLCVQFTLTVKFLASVMGIKMVMNGESGRTAEQMVMIYLTYYSGNHLTQ